VSVMRCTLLNPPRGRGRNQQRVHPT
jgi:hypothetical protein